LVRVPLGGGAALAQLLALVAAAQPLAEFLGTFAFQRQPDERLK
jgi:hypothetical protein